MRQSALRIKILEVGASDLCEEYTVIGIRITHRLGKAGRTKELTATRIDLFVGLYLSYLHCDGIIGVFGKVDEFKIEDHITALNFFLCMGLSVDEIVKITPEIFDLTVFGKSKGCHIVTGVTVQPYVGVKGNNSGKAYASALFVWHNGGCLCHYGSVLFHLFAYNLNKFLAFHFINLLVSKF